MAADRAFVSCERLVATDELLADAHPATLRINRSLVSGVVLAPNGAHFTSCAPDYERDEGFQLAYVESAGDPERWSEFRARYLDGDEDSYQAAIGAGVPR
jgi:glutaconate CoA-transferase subunit A